MVWSGLGRCGLMWICCTRRLALRALCRLKKAEEERLRDAEKAEKREKKEKK